jgi:menaquinone-dependent protoporphyrinogen oxidase
MLILIAHASKHGSTAEVAERIGAVLRGRGHLVDVVAASAVDALDPYDAVILGGALYIGRLHRAARRFLHRNATALDERPFAVFAMGPLTLSEKDVAGAGAQLARALGREPGLRPCRQGVFGGVVRPAELPFPFNRMPAADARDWDAIEAWANAVAGDFGDAGAAVA